MKRNRIVVLFILIATTGVAQNVDSLLLKNFRPKSIYNVPVAKIEKAKFPVIDVHTHNWVSSPDTIRAWVKKMDQLNIEKSIILTYATGKIFDSVYKLYAPFGNRFEVWCGFDYTGCNEPGWSDKAVKELERCVKVGAKGVGELGDKGLGEVYSLPVPGIGMHIDDVRMKPLLTKCGELRLPISIHVAEPMWMYEPMDSTNDGLMNAYLWKVDKTQPNLLDHAALIKTLENAVRDNPGTNFIACHLANCEYDLSILGRLFDKYTNLYADIAARFGEIGPIPRYMAAFFQKYQDRIVYGTDMGTEEKMYEMTFRLLESTDEHFYITELTKYHSAVYGFGLPDAVLKKVYRDNILKIKNRSSPKK